MRGNRIYSGHKDIEISLWGQRGFWTGFCSLGSAFPSPLVGMSHSPREMAPLDGAGSGDGHIPAAGLPGDRTVWQGHGQPGLRSRGHEVAPCQWDVEAAAQISTRHIQAGMGALGARVEQSTASTGQDGAAGPISLRCSPGQQGAAGDSPGHLVTPGNPVVAQDPRALNLSPPAADPCRGSSCGAGAGAGAAECRANDRNSS